MKLKKSTSIVALALLSVCLFATNVSATDLGQVPAAAKSMVNPVDADDEAIMKKAKKKYKRSCKKCHGSKGNGKGPGAKDMNPMPPNWTKGIKATDGELFWITMNGSKDSEMKGWKAGTAKKGKEFSEEEAWAVVHYIRSFVK